MKDEHKTVLKQLKDTTDPVQPEKWVNTEKEAERWELPPERVDQLATQVQEEKALEIELKVRRREAEMLTYLRQAYDREAQNVLMCRWLVDKERPCGEGPFHTWGDLSAHLRLHLIMDTADERIQARVLADVDKLVHPTEELGLKVKAPEQARGELLNRLAAQMARHLKGPAVGNLPHAGSNPNDDPQDVPESRALPHGQSPPEQNEPT